MILFSDHALFDGWMDGWSKHFKAMHVPTENIDLKQPAAQVSLENQVTGSCLLCQDDLIDNLECYSTSVRSPCMFLVKYTGV